MKPSHINLRGTAVAAAAIVMFTVSARSAPTKSEPVPAVQPAVPEKKGVFGKLKSALSFKKHEEAPVPAQAPVAKTKATAKVTAAPPGKVIPPSRPAAIRAAAPQEKAPPVVKNKTALKPAAPKIVAAEEKAAPEKKGFFKKMFSKSPEDAPVEPKLAKAKTAKPAPVKVAKPETKLATETIEEPQKKRGLFGFLRGGGSKSRNEKGFEISASDKIVRPDDWEEHRIVQDDEIAIYSFGPSQPLGPDDRLARGTLVKVKKVMKGWALVEVHGGITGYMDASMLREAEKNDFADPPAPAAAVASLNLKAWAPAPPPPDLPDQPGTMDNSGALLLLPPLELEPKP